MISDDSAFVILDVNIKNNGDDRDINLKRFHIMNGVSNVTEESNIYGDYFKDLGRIYNGDVVKSGDEVSFIMVFRVPKKLEAKRFVLFYQELDEKSKLRKIKLNIQNLSKIEKQKDLKIGDSFELNIKKAKEELSVDSVNISDSQWYTVKDCNMAECYTEKKQY